MPPDRPRHTGLSRLLPYAAERKGQVTLIAILAALSAAAPVAGWLLVEDATNNGIRTGNDDRLVLVVAAYVAVNAAAWVLGTLTWLGLASVGQRIVLELRRDLFHHLTSLSLRYFSQQKAGWIISRLNSDVDALSDVLNQGLTTLVVNTLTLVAAVGGLFLLDWRLGLVALCILPPGIVITRWFQRVSHVAAADVRTRIATVTAQLAESVAGMAVIQAFNRERAFQAEFDGLNEENRRLERPRAEDLLRLLPRDRAARCGRDGIGALRGRALHRHGLDGDRDADRRRRPPGARLPATPGALRAVRPGAGGERGDGQDQLGAGRGDRRRRQARRAPARPDRRPARARRRHLRLRQGAGPARDRDLGATGRVHRAGRRVRRRQVDDGEADRPVLRPRPGRGPRRRHGPPRRRTGRLPAPARGRAPGSVPLQRHDRGQHPLREAGRIRRGGEGDGSSRRGRPRRGASRQRARPCRPRGRRGTLGRRASADLDRAGATGRPPDPDSRRGDVEHRPADGDRDRAGVRPAARRTDVDHHRAPARDRQARGRDPRARARTDRPARQRTRADGPGLDRSAGWPTSSSRIRSRPPSRSSRDTSARSRGTSA